MITPRNSLVTCTNPGKAGSDANPAFADAYYQLTKNPFENVIASATAKFRIGENTDVKIIPYYWYGYGTGGNQQRCKLNLHS
jgi:iron complex outermembrane receptor protein